MIEKIHEFFVKNYDNIEGELVCSLPMKKIQILINCLNVFKGFLMKGKKELNGI